MFGKIKPNNGYCLYFPNRPEGKRFVAGRSVRVGLWEEWKHIKLGQFGVLLPDTSEPELITTAEDLEVQVKADFKIVVGGREEDRETRLERATISCPPTRSIKDVIELEFFQKWAKNYCKNSIKRVVKDSSFIRLIEEVNYRSEAMKRIREDLEKNLDTIGLILVESNVLIEPLEPKGILATRKILDRWLEYRKTVDEANWAKQKALNEDNIAKQKLEDERKKQEEELHHQQNIRNKEQNNNSREYDRQLDIKEKEQIRNKEEAIRKFDEEIAQWAHQAQLRKIELDAQIDSEKERQKEIISQIKRENEQQNKEHEAALQEQEMHHKQEMESRELHHKQEIVRRKLEILEIEKDANEKRLTVMQLKEKVSVLEMELERKRGEVRANLIERETLAKSADVIKMKELLFGSLPQIAKELYRPIEKMGEIRVNYFGGTENLDQNGFLKGLMGSVSTIPLIKGILGFLKDFENGNSDFTGNKGANLDLKELKSDDLTNGEQCMKAG